MYFQLKEKTLQLTQITLKLKQAPISQAQKMEGLLVYILPLRNLV